MDIKQCYDEMGGDYADILARLRNVSLIEKLIKKFEADTSMKDLEEGLKEKDVEKSFRAAHTLKGICLNLSLKQLVDDAVNITEILRAGSLEGTEELFNKLKKEYDETIDTIHKLG
jgi:histidine phosphotransfer protein HptB